MGVVRSVVQCLAGNFEEMTSYQPSRSSAYSNYLRWIMVHQREILGCSYEQLSRNLGVEESTVRRTMNIFNTTGTVAKNIYPKDKSFRKLTLPAQLLILNLIERPYVYLSEIQKEFEKTLWIEVNVSTISRFLKVNCFTRQKLHRVALQQDLFLRQQFISDISIFSKNMFIFIDETGTDYRNSLRQYGYSLRGNTPTTHELLIRGERISAIACMSLYGLLNVEMFRGMSNGDIFYDFIQTQLIPHIMPYNGINPHSVVILDNCSIHHVPEVH